MQFLLPYALEEKRSVIRERVIGFLPFFFFGPRLFSLFKVICDHVTSGPKFDWLIFLFSLRERVAQIRFISLKRRSRRKGRRRALARQFCRFVPEFVDNFPKFCNSVVFFRISHRIKGGSVVRLAQLQVDVVGVWKIRVCEKLSRIAFRENRRRFSSFLQIMVC